MTTMPGAEVLDRLIRLIQEGQGLLDDLLEILHDYDQLRRMAETVESEHERLRDEVTRLRAEVDRYRNERDEIAESLYQVLSRVRALRT